MSKKLFALGLGGLAIIASLALSAVANAGGDRNRDRIPDRWEQRHHLSLKANQAGRDQDHDGLNNRGEYKAGLDPRDDDSDNDGTEDGDENAGTIETFTGGALTVRLAGGGTLTATVTPDTEIECEHTPATAASGDDEGDDGEHEHGNHDDGDDDHGDDEDTCGGVELTAGRKVDEGELKTADGGAVWEKLELGA